MATAIIVAAGQGVRMGEATPKQYLHLARKPILWHTCKAVLDSPFIKAFIAVVPTGDIEYCRRMLADLEKPGVSFNVLAGGRQRQDSVYNGLVGVSDRTSPVLIHDGVRPFVTPDQIERCIVAAENDGAAMLATKATDTVKEVNTRNFVVATIPRHRLWLAQTPQAFRYEMIRSAHEKALANRWQVTDDAALMERIGIPVRIVRGSRLNIKITTSEDLLLAEAIFHSTQKAFPQ